MAIVVVGAGAIGLLIAGRLAQSPATTVLLARPAVAAALAQHRLRILQDGVLQIVDHLTVITDPAALERYGHKTELAILCVKAYDTVGALATLEALRPQTILTIQNGIGNEEILAERFGAERVISGAITISVEVEAPGRIAVTKGGGIGLASVDGKTDVEPWLKALGDAGFQVRRYGDYRALKWSKALLNMLGNATAAILDISVAAVYADRRLIALERRAILEALHVMERLGIQPINLPRYPATLLSFGMRWVPAALADPLLRRKIAQGRGGKAPSLLLDLARGHGRSEGEFLYGAVVCAAAEAGIDTPVNRAFWDILHGIAAGEIAWDDYRRNPEQLLAAVAEGQATEQNKLI